MRSGVVSLALGVSCFLIFSSTVFASKPGSKNGHESVLKIGQQAPNFDLKNAKGQSLGLGGLLPGYVLVHFWATWCPPCIEEFPALEVLARRYKSKPFTIVGVSVDNSWAEIVAFQRQFPGPGSFSFPIVLDADKRVANLYGTSKFPESFLIGPDGRVLEVLIGAQNWLDEAWLSRLDGYLLAPAEKKIK